MLRGQLSTHSNAILLLSSSTLPFGELSRCVVHLLSSFSLPRLFRLFQRHLVLSIPPLPPKNPLSRFRPAFLDRRRRLLQYWLANILLHPEIGGVDVVKKWVIN